MAGFVRGYRERVKALESHLGFEHVAGGVAHDLGQLARSDEDQCLETGLHQLGLRSETNMTLKELCKMRK